FCFFFFQAEDGIRDPLVTGVQTCALPISSPPQVPTPGVASASVSTGPPATATFLSLPSAKNPIHCPSGEKNGVIASSVPAIGLRSEERRVGKECRSRDCECNERDRMNTIM